MPKPLDKPLDLHYSLPVAISSKSPHGHHESTIDDDLDFFSSSMVATGASSPYIKDEPDDFNFLHNYPPAHPPHQAFSNLSHQLGSQSLHNVHASDMSLSNGNFGQFGGAHQPGVQNNYSLTNSGIDDDELLDLDLDLNEAPHHSASLQNQHVQSGTSMRFVNQDRHMAQHQAQFSRTPEGAPIQSPFVHGNFNYASFIDMQQRSQSAQQNAHASPQIRPVPSHHYTRPSQVPTNMKRQPSDSTASLTPKTPGIGSLNLDAPRSGSVPTQPIVYGDKQKRTSGHWESHPDSLRSLGDTPISSSNYTSNPAQITDILKSGKYGSLPAKVEASSSFANPQSQEAKRRRRRESHNLVERRRRDNINEKIQELSRLLPQHRLDDERIRKHLANNTPLSPGMTATGMSPPQSSSLLMGGRRSQAGSMSIGLPPDDKDKGPNKGDILTGSVSWTRDLMWALYEKYQQEDELAETLSSLGQQWPFQQTEEDRRMRGELMAAMELNEPASFAYSRGPGSGLCVPQSTNVAGDAIEQTQSGGSSSSPHQIGAGDHDHMASMMEDNSFGHHQHFQAQHLLHTNQHQRQSPSHYWTHLKEEDECGMEMN